MTELVRWEPPSGGRDVVDGWVGVLVQVEELSRVIAGTEFVPNAFPWATCGRRSCDPRRARDRRGPDDSAPALVRHRGSPVHVLTANARARPRGRALDPRGRANDHPLHSAREAARRRRGDRGHVHDGRREAGRARPPPELGEEPARDARRPSDRRAVPPHLRRRHRRHRADRRGSRRAGRGATRDACAPPGGATRDTGRATTTGRGTGRAAGAKPPPSQDRAGGR